MVPAFSHNRASVTNRCSNSSDVKPNRRQSIHTR